ncbi:replication initiator [Actinomadura nitritigenes]|uniref:replication initiator n=1 Tax=Actinomadura nitritigenes TaxID=134602 RepID=UPI0027DB29D5|nr:replication initiator [Actinomadura nitritigenes]
MKPQPNRPTASLPRTDGSPPFGLATRYAHHLRRRFTIAKVAEHQRRGGVHFHAVIRFDGPGGPTAPPPGWTDVRLLEDAVRHAVGAVSATTPAGPDIPARSLTWDPQVDVRAMTSSGHARRRHSDPHRVVGGVTALERGDLTPTQTCEGGQEDGLLCERAVAAGCRSRAPSPAADRPASGRPVPSG